MRDIYETSQSELDDAWDTRFQEMRYGTAEKRWAVLDNNAFWEPSHDNSAETTMEIAWDKARLDAVEICGRMALEHPNSVIDRYQIARITAGQLADMHESCLVGGKLELGSMIVVENDILLSRILFPGVRGLLPSNPDPELTIQYVEREMSENPEMYAGVTK